MIEKNVCLIAGGRGGAIATKGGSGFQGPHKSDPNDDSGSFSVILVVILPVAQMIAVLILILIIRICYRKYCSQNEQNSQQIKKPIYGNEGLNPSIHCNKF
ncbi:unnamed protein product [Oppiella nova]|uniref:Uncharacterized protein n=1 Tax=Oppiella nova TaxID=334625 RepID=A0A7R9QQI9_9ACAR|nr:unnamed protein product [Oppiella nova]CAG2170613.1 unnamed protein product [Oppiella nova]